MNDIQKREIDEIAARWSYAELWDKYPVPSRPDEEELSIEKEAILASALSPKDVNVMILGSTIEYRSMCKQFGIAPYVIDFSRANFDSLSSYSKVPFDDEHFVESDWLKIEFAGFFDFILGHRPFNVIRADQVPTLFEKMYFSLKPGGVFFCRGNVRFPNHEDQLENIVKRWAFAEDRKYPLFSYIEVALYMHCADGDGYLDYPKAREVIDGFHVSGKISANDYKEIRLLISMPSGTKFRSFIDKNDLEADIKVAGFSSIEWLFTSHEFTKNMPILKLTK